MAGIHDPEISWPGLTARLALDAVLDAAFTWLCQRWRDWSPNADIWSFRRDWQDEKQRLQVALLSGEFRFRLLDRVTKADGSEAGLWSARDALVLKALSLVLARVLAVSPRGTHIEGNGGAKAAVRQVSAALAANCFVLRTGVKSYYAWIDHMLLLDRMSRPVLYRNITNSVRKYLRRTEERGGCFRDYERGISLGYPLSPVIRAFFLDELDRRMAETGLFYVHFMDDILVLAPTRWKLRRAIAEMNRIPGLLRLEKHPAKTFVGRIEREFDFLGYRFSRGPLQIAQQSFRNYALRLDRIYEQQRTAPTCAVRLDVYVTRWMRWCRSGLGGLLIVASSLSLSRESQQAQQAST